jgi:predicted Zn-dependent protease
MRTLRVRLISFAGVALLGASQLGCPVNPATGERQLILFSESQEIAMGQQGAQQVAAALGLYDDPDLQQYVSDIGLALAAQSEKPDLPWSFQVVDDPIVNAFALPGGFIFVTRGILAHFNSEAELAGVLGHEIGHVTARHSAEQISRAQVAQIGYGVGAAFVPEIARYGDLIGGGFGLLFLKFGRDDERQSDDLGFRYMSSVGYDPAEMVDVFNMLGRVTEAAGGSQIPNWLSTHPDPGEREERIQQAIAEAGGQLSGEVRRERYLRMLDDVTFGVNPRNGFFRGSTFLHPDLEFQIAFPEGWRTQNAVQFVAGISADEDALIQLTLASETSVDAAASQFFSQEGVRLVRDWSEAIHGNPARWGTWNATTQDGTVLAGQAVFLEFDGRIYQILGYTLENTWNKYRTVFASSSASFDRLTDREVLSVQPQRLDIVELDRAMTLREFDQRHPSDVDLATLSLINGVGEDERVQAGAQLKRVVGTPVPGN